MRYLSLFSGGAGGDLACQHLLNWECVGYVEWDKYCCRVLEQRIKDGLLSDAPIFYGDIREWLRLGYAGAYSGLVDVVTGGWPCQPHSSAGKRLGAEDEREGWPAVIETLCQVRPKWFLGENVGDVLSTDAGRYFGGVLRDLAALGYVARWGVFPACAFGAPHPRERLFIVAHTDGERRVGWRNGKAGRKSAQGRIAPKWTQDHAQGERPIQAQVWRESPTDLLGVVNGLGSRVDRIRACGNGQVPIVVATAWHLLTEGIL